ncbi:hypothetical protein Ppb6_01298 [Photorhabdus australis subsp. thailandensis]|uniref:Uncharacterized protein n=1 Tax=Photorhabdus australis subsp. thailandensis TaxID=2805096 RepID=A0A1C0U6F1_9GAMM|nr:hypothetical protein Ppb6_01298 [Photorhabdus australis subsp. thailandensis]
MTRPMAGYPGVADIEFEPQRVTIETRPADLS